MNNFKNNIKKNFTATPNTIINDGRLSWKAKGIFLYLASKPNDWYFYMDEIKKNAIDGKEALQSGIKELESHDYLTRKPVNSGDGRFDGWHWTLKMPTDKDLTVKGVNHQTGKPPGGSSTGRETPSTNTNKDSTNTDNTNKETHSARENEQSIVEKIENGESKQQLLSDIWIPYLRKKGKRVNVQTQELILYEWRDLSLSDVKRCMKHSMANEWGQLIDPNDKEESNEDLGINPHANWVDG